MRDFRSLFFLTLLVLIIPTTPTTTMSGFQANRETIRGGGAM